MTPGFAPDDADLGEDEGDTIGMFGLTDAVGRASTRAASYAALCLLSMAAGTLGAKAETRTLKFYHLHTHEKAEIAYKRDGRYIPDGLKKINWILRDWRKQQPTNQDPRLLDLVWEAYRQSGSRAYINVICGYRSAGTNNMLRSRTSGVAKESQHTAGRALDFYLPDVPLKKLREIGLKMQIGGVGFYPKSGSPFVHFDVGNVRHWPKMNRNELLAVFPKGNTLHVPSDGRPLPGYEQALASYKSRKGANSIQVANASDRPSSGGGKTLFAALFGGGSDEEEDTADVEVAPARSSVKAAEPKKPAREAPVAVAALVPTAKPNALASGVPLPIRDTFDTTAPKRPVPAVGVAEEPEAVALAALDPSRVPLPQAAPMREAAVEVASAAPVVPVPSAPAGGRPAAIDAALVAAMEKSDVADEIAAGASGQLAYNVPTPRGRPPFASILKGDGATSESIDAVKEILDSASAAEPPAVLTASAPAKIGALVAAAATHPPVAAHTPAPKPMLLASLEPQRVATARPAPAGKTGRFQAEAAVSARPAAKVPAPSFGSRLRMASLVTAPDKRSEVTRMNKPKADRLVREIPSAVLTAGFTPGPLAKAPNGFVGSAVKFLPVVKFD